VPASSNILPWAKTKLKARAYQVYFGENGYNPSISVCNPTSFVKLLYIQRLIFHAARAEEVLIAVMGATGSGKTTFISTLIEEDVGIRHGLKSGQTLPEI
jgi:ATPase subunit of ABC transporter with duplicated ATPase domains